ncbi:zinc ribbon domain-containing protein [Thermodesulfovibrionales bacterium]|nr:zinc ribbon domain-containing protein [Thermodesulfovibrionales bacterium]MCL0033588.1 zinc ribbon domain-containing protein [Thermodesulfovibrionales bacterium]MCL0046682.1 zinc ribbon domain-containing protein [Thermodesulfovibrionales bacterium]MCL0051452.1 zinc ribbon domain-containing protein [Thermodesulfovibrionales bacterium]MCL0062141.1 zinc ribbon domain-containing protein [Thermodesulfovibrionales bacterium]
MPIFEYKCGECGQEFEKLVFGNQEITCSKCESKNTNKKMSVFGMSGVENPTSSGCSSCSSSTCSSCK